MRNARRSDLSQIPIYSIICSPSLRNKLPNGALTNWRDYCFLWRNCPRAYENAHRYPVGFNFEVLYNKLTLLRRPFPLPTICTAFTICFFQVSLYHFDAFRWSLWQNQYSHKSADPVRSRLRQCSAAYVPAMRKLTMPPGALCQLQWKYRPLPFRTVSLAIRVVSHFQCVAVKHFWL